MFSLCIVAFDFYFFNFSPENDRREGLALLLCHDVPAEIPDGLGAQEPRGELPPEPHVPGVDLGLVQVSLLHQHLQQVAGTGDGALQRGDEVTAKEDFCITG